MELGLFPFALRFMCLNGVAVVVKWENLKFNPIFFSKGDLKWVSIGSTTLNIQWVCNEFNLAVQDQPYIIFIFMTSLVRQIFIYLKNALTILIKTF
jgi:hypothetical protein